MTKRNILVTGSASGIGAAIASGLRRDGHRVIGADLHDADIEADLGTSEGRAQLIDGAAVLAADGLDGVVACAGVSGLADPNLVISVNYFGAVATIEGLRPLLLRSPTPRVVAIISSVSILPHSSATVAACLSGDENAARVAAHSEADKSYVSSKYALARWLRRTATHPDWAGSGILLNGINPGVIKTPMTADLLASEHERARLRKIAPIAVSDYCEPEVIAEAACFLATLEGSYLVGQLLFVDGGSDAIMRPESV